MAGRKPGRLALFAIFAALLSYGTYKFTEPGGGLPTHVAYLTRIMRQARCEPLAAAPLGSPSALSACLSFNGDTRRELLEWLAFHRLQGVSRFDVFWDVIGAYNATRHAAFLDELQPLLSKSGGDVHVWSKADFGPLKDQIATAAGFARAEGSTACAPTAADVEVLSKQVRTCISPDSALAGTWGCQDAMGAICLAAAKVRGDEWLGLFDVDEYFFSPGRPRHEDECLWGGAPGRGPGFHSTAVECSVPISEAPLLTGRDLVTTLRRFSLLYSSIVVEGVVFGMAENYTREGLVLQSHVRAALIDASGRLSPPLGYTRDTCPDWFCRLMTPKKSFLRVIHAPLSGLRIHHHDSGPFTVERPAPGALLRLNHYAFDDLAAVVRRGSRPTYYDGVNHYTPLLENRGGMADFTKAAQDESGRALVPLLEHCMKPLNRDRAECRPGNF